MYITHTHWCFDFASESWNKKRTVRELHAHTHTLSLRHVAAGNIVSASRPSAGTAARWQNCLPCAFCIGSLAAHSVCVCMYAAWSIYPTHSPYSFTCALAAPSNIKYGAPFPVLHRRRARPPRRPFLAALSPSYDHCVFLISNPERERGSERPCVCADRYRLHFPKEVVLR